MHIVQLEISNFRGIQKAVITLPQHGVLFGRNNVGKSAIADALALLFGRERMTYGLSDWDFYGGAPSPESRFTLIATIAGFGDNESRKFPRWFMGESSARPVWWHADSKSISYEDAAPAGAELAAQIALSARFNEETCEFETIRYFYDGPCDPFTDEYRPVSTGNVVELGVFILPGNRQWDRLLAFGSSSFLKVLRQNNALPTSMLSALKAEMRSPDTKVEEAPELKALLGTAEEELRAFGMLESSGRLIYRATSLDTMAVLQSLVPHFHISGAAAPILPLARQGSGTLALQAFLVVLALGKNRRDAGNNFILIAEEPELHLHPALQSRLTNRIRSLSSQSLVTTHSSTVAASYQPTDALYVRNAGGKVDACALRSEPVRSIGRNAVERLYLQDRAEFYESLMGGPILIPEGRTDYEWLRLWQRVATAADVSVSACRPSPLSIIPTADAAVVPTTAEVAKFREDVLPIVDGDDAGNDYVKSLAASHIPRCIVQLGHKAEIETLSAWILEPCLRNPGPILATHLAAGRNRKDIERVCLDMKKSREFRENVAWEAISNADAMARASAILGDLARIAQGEPPKDPGWKPSTLDGVQVVTATHICVP